MPQPGRSDYRAIHVPWWKAVDLDLENPPLAADLVTANHCLAEMHDNAMKYYVRLANAALKPKAGTFLFEGWGYELLRSRGIVTQEFNAAGFRMAMLEKERWHFRRTARWRRQRICRGPPPTEKLRSALRRLLRLEPVLHGYEISAYAGRNTLSAFVRQTQEDTRKNATVHYSDVTAFLATAYKGIKRQRGRSTSWR